MTPSIHDIPELAIRQLQDYRNVNPGTCFADPDFSLDVETAYHLQDAVTALRLSDGAVSYTHLTLPTMLWV